jgi:hypothetical protein
MADSLSSPGENAITEMGSSGQLSNDNFCYIVEGHLLLIVGSIGVVGNVWDRFHKIHFGRKVLSFYDRSIFI